MASISYEDIYSRFYTKVEAFDLAGQEDEDMWAEFMCNWLRSALSYPHIRKLFKTVAADDNAEQVEYEISYSIDPLSDRDFVVELLAYAMVQAWVEPKVQSITNITQFFGETDKKYYSQAAHLSELRALRNDAENRVRGMIRDRGYLNNPYLDGNVKMRPK